MTEVSIALEKWALAMDQQELPGNTPQSEVGRLACDFMDHSSSASF
ncbi:MAG: hypothetical protein ABGX16_12935 [Pirellulales bacterium]